MKEMSVFDVIGPNMIGPSSSHTAGALRIARLVRSLVEGEVARVRFILYGSFAKTYRGHGTDRALVAGVLGFDTEDPRIRDSFEWARKAGLAYSFGFGDETLEPHPNTVEVVLTTAAGDTTRVTGVSVGGGRVLLTKIDGVEIRLSGEYHTLFIHQKDTPGVVAHIASSLAQYQINIAFMRLYRESKGENAYTVIEADNPVPRAVCDQITAHENIVSATVIPL